MSAEEIGEAIRVEAMRVHDDRAHLTKQIKVHVHPEDWAELRTYPPRSMVDEPTTKAVWGCTVILDDTQPRGAPTAE